MRGLTRLLQFIALPALAALAVPLTATAANASTATITLSGTVTCVPHYVEGVWIEVGTGNSGWAKMSVAANTSATAAYTRTFTATLPTNIRLHVGCGGTPQSWWSDNRTPSSSRVFGAITGSRSHVDARCNDGPVALWPGGKPPSSDNVRCSWGSYPADNAICIHTGSASGPCANYDWGYWRSSTWFDYGYGHTLNPRDFAYRNCTDYAAWRVGSLTWSSFRFPAGVGNAKDWATYPYYANAGFTRSTTPQIGDLAVWTSTSLGHVGVVVTVNPLVVEDYNFNSTGTDLLRAINSQNPPPNWYLHR
jgi:surface antigen